MIADIEGFNAYMVGTLKEHNPYHPGSQEYIDWNIGWDDGREQYYSILDDIVGGPDYWSDREG